MKTADGLHTTNYFDALILPSEDCKAVAAIPKAGTVAGLQFEMLAAPYQITSDELLVAVTGTRREVPREEWDALHAEIFSKGQACLRASPLVKSQGWAVHFDALGHIALVDPTTLRFEDLKADPTVSKVAGMRNARMRSEP